MHGLMNLTLIYDCSISLLTIQKSRNVVQRSLPLLNPRKMPTMIISNQPCPLNTFPGPLSNLQPTNQIIPPKNHQRPSTNPPQPINHLPRTRQALITAIQPPIAPNRHNPALPNIPDQNTYKPPRIPKIQRPHLPYRPRKLPIRLLLPPTLHHPPKRPRIPLIAAEHLDIAPILHPHQLVVEQDQLLYPLRVHLRVAQGDCPAVRVAQEDGEGVQTQMLA